MGQHDRSFPDGIRPHQAERGPFLHRHASPFSILLLGGVLGSALLGLFGGGKASIRIDDAPKASLSIATPHVMRNGTFFETRIDIAAKTDLTDATLTIQKSLWRDLTINSQIPQASEEEYKGDAFRFHYGRLAAGDTLSIKIDGQINPPLFAGTSGTIGLRDGEALLASVPLTIRVLP